MKNDRGDKELEKYIRECAQYLVGQNGRFSMVLTTTTGEKKRSQTRVTELYNRTDIDAILDKIKAMNKALEAAETVSNELSRREPGGRIPRSGPGGRELRTILRRARSGIIDGRIAGLQAIKEAQGCRTQEREMNGLKRKQLSAVRLAVGYFVDPKDRDARGVARKIMEKAGIEEPSKSKFTYLMKWVRDQ